jgi:hypothetical protein
VKPVTLHITVRQARAFALARGGISAPFDDPLAAVRAMVTVTPVRHLGSIAQYHVQDAFEELRTWSGAHSTTVAWQD